MNNLTLSGIGAALAVGVATVALTSPSVHKPNLERAPELLIPIGDLMPVSEPQIPLSPLFLSGFAPTGNPLFDELLAPKAEVTSGGELIATNSPALAAAGAINKKSTAKATNTPDSNPKSALTANTVALRGAAVNILCIPKDGSVKSISGSGVIIDPRGIILTVAHVGQMYLLNDYPTTGNISCVIRTGSPAQAAYTAELVYVSPTWIKKSPDTLVALAPTGTGAHDFALLAITGSATGSPLPASFPSVPLSNTTSQAGDALGVGSYGAQYLDNMQKRTGLYQTLVYGVVTKPFTFTTNKTEALSVKAGSAAQLGSSGGGMVNTKGEYVGLITNSVITGDFSTRELRAITPLHIRESFKKDTGEDLDSYLSSKSPRELIYSFSEEARSLGSLVIEAIN